MAGKPSSSDLDNFLFSMKRASSHSVSGNDLYESFGTGSQTLGASSRSMEYDQPLNPIGQRSFRGSNQQQLHPPRFQNRNQQHFVRPSFTLTNNEPGHRYDKVQPTTGGILNNQQNSMNYHQGQNSSNFQSLMNNRQNRQAQFENQQAPINNPMNYNQGQNSSKDFQSLLNNRQNLQAQFDNQQAPINRQQALFKDQHAHPPDNQQLSFRPQNPHTVRQSHPSNPNIRPQLNYVLNRTVHPMITDQTNQINSERFPNHSISHIANVNTIQSVGPPCNARDLQRNQPFSSFGNSTAQPLHQPISHFQQSLGIPVQRYQSKRSSSSGDFNNFKPAPASDDPPITPIAFNTGYLSSDNSGKSLNDKLADQIWVDSWLQSLKKKEKSPPKRTVLTISNYKSCLQEAVRLRAELENLVSCVDNITDSDQWEAHMDNLKKTQSRLGNLNQILTDEATLENIKRLVLKRKLKRERLKRRRVEEYKDGQDELSKRERLHQEIDKIQNKLLEKSQQEKQNKEMKATADKILSEVRRKLSETNRMVEIITGLRKLRQLKCQSVYSNGMYLGMESDNDFSEKAISLLTLLTDQKKVYEAEEKTLKVMLETEQEETKEREKEKARLFKEAKERREERLMNERVFGKEDKLTYNDPLMPYKQFYQQAETNLDSLVAIRQTWDMYLVGEQTPGSSVIPQEWVLASAPSDDNWTTFLKQ